MPILSMQASTRSFGASTLTPKTPKTSALPDWLDTERLPCLATFTPAPATTKADAVEILKVPFWSPPVPQVTKTVLDPTLTRWAFSRITRAAPVISSTVSPFTRKAVRKEATCKGVASPVMIWFMTSIVSASERLTRLTSFSIASRIFMVARSFVSPIGGKRLGKILLVLQSLQHLVRLVTSAVLPDADAVPKLVLVAHLRHVGPVAFIQEPINPDLGCPFVWKGI